MKPEGVTPAEAQTIASVLSGELKVKISPGQYWNYNYDDKTIYYRRVDLSTLTEDDVVSNLLHEAGHAHYSNNPRDVIFSGVSNPSHAQKLGDHLLNIPEDFRVEDKLRDYFPYANNYLPEYSFKTIYALESLVKGQYSDGDVPKYIQYCILAYETLSGIKLESVNSDTFDKDVHEAIAKTATAILGARKAQSTFDIGGIIGRDIYPHIQQFLDEFSNPGNPFTKVILSEEERPEYEDLFPDIKNLIPPTQAALNRVLTDSKFDKYVGRFRSGKLIDGGKLYKYKLGDTKLFSRRYEAKTKEYVVSLVIDKSGSMYDERDEYTGEEGNGKINNAIRTAILLAHVLDKMGIAFSIHGFADRTKHYKKPLESFDPGTPIFQDIFESDSEGGGTAIGSAITQVTKLIRPYKERKIMFVVTDGQSGDDIIRPIEEATRLGIDVVGVGIGRDSDYVDRSFKTKLTIRNPNELPKRIVKELKKKLRGKVRI